MEATHIKTILVPTDFSDKSERARKLAVQMALRHNAELIMIHAMGSRFITDRTGRQVIGADIVKMNTEKADKALQNIKKTALKRHPQLLIRTILKTGMLLDVLNETIENHDNTIVVMGMSGQQRLKELFLGSYSYEVLVSVKCSVLLVPVENRKTFFRNILVPIRNANQSHTKIALTKAIAERNRSEVTLCGVANEDTLLEVQHELTTTEPLIENTHCKTELVLTADKAEAISRISNKDKSDLIILSYHDEAIWKSFFGQNFFKRIINRTSSPLFFIKSQPEVTPLPNTDQVSGYDLSLPIPG